MFDKLALDLGTPGMSVVERRILANARTDIEWLGCVATFRAAGW
jgi:hypothetical protein